MAKFLQWTCPHGARFLLVLLQQLLAGVLTQTVDYKDYTGHSVLRVVPRHEEDVRLLLSFSEHPGVEFWQEPTAAKRNVDIRVSPDAFPVVDQHIRDAGLEYNTMMPDLQSLINEEREIRSSVVPNTGADSFNISTYHSYDEIMEWLDTIAEECGEACSTLNIGRSTEGRLLKVFKIGNDRPNKPIIWVDAGIHAREWIAPATAIHIIAQLVEGTRSGPTRYLVNRYTWYILPLANPDGYEYTWSTDRLWRKTRSVNPDSNCRGTDPNRNWNFHWGGPGTSDNPCREDYHGIYPFSEPETRAMALQLWTLRDRLAIYLSLHSYGQYWLTPWGYTFRVPSDYSDMVDLGTMASDAMRESYGSQYDVGSSSQMLYPASGGSDDWAKGVARVKYAYTVELGDKGTHGFILPPDFIPRTGEEMMKGLRTLAVGVLRRRRERPGSRRGS